MHQPSGGDFTCGRRVHLQLKGSSRLLGYVEKYRCLWQSGVVWRDKIDSSARKQTRDLSIKLWVLYQLSYQGIHVPPPNNLAIISWPYGHELRWPYICTNLQVVTSPVVEEFIFNYKVPLDCLDMLRNIDVCDSLVLFGEKKLTPQPGNKPGTSQLSFECSTNWATRESMFPPPNNLAMISWPYGHELRCPYICTNLQVVTSPVVEEFIFN